MYTLFISDLHLHDQWPEGTALFLSLLRKCEQEVDALYILGDLFEYWIGDDDDNATAIDVQQALQQLTKQGIPVFIMQGNRDFLLGQRFMQHSGCQLLPDPHVIDLYGQDVMLSHGDQYTQDRWYLRYRRFVHRPTIQRLFLSLPLRWRHYVAKRLRGDHSDQSTAYNVDADHATIKQILTQQQQYYVIHGHTHQPCIHYNKNNEHWRFVLSDWHQQGNALLCSATEKYRLIYFSQESLQTHGLNHAK